jgi:hypothetical protein
MTEVLDRRRIRKTGRFKTYPELVAAVKAMDAEGIPKFQIAEDVEVSRPTITRMLTEVNPPPEIPQEPPLTELLAKLWPAPPH